MTSIVQAVLRVYTLQTVQSIRYHESCNPETKLIVSEMGKGFYSKLMVPELAMALIFTC